MPKTGKNKAKRVGAMNIKQEWFAVKQQINKRRKKLAKKSKKKNRR